MQTIINPNLNTGAIWGTLSPHKDDVMHGAKLKIESIDSVYINCIVLETA